MNVELVYGPLARELDPRALEVGAAPERRVAIAFRQRGLESVRSELAGLGSAALERSPTGRPFATLWIDREELFSAAGAEGPLAVFREAQKNLERPLSAPEIMGVINVTPDSFSDGGRFLDPSLAVAHGRQLALEGAHSLDIGGESTRPGAEPVPEHVELERVLPVVEGLAASTDAELSIDTSKAGVAKAALNAGATIVNDVTAGEGDPQMLDLVAERGCRFVLMHKRGAPKDMQDDPRYADATAEVTGYLRERTAACLQAGIEPSKIVLDPGIGFGKRLEHNLSLLRRLREVRSLGRPLLLGVSRKSFIGHIAGTETRDAWRTRESRRGPAAEREDRIGGTAAAVTACVWGGAELLRVHDVSVMAQAARVAYAVSSYEEGEV